MIWPGVDFTLSIQILYMYAGADVICTVHVQMNMYATGDKGSLTGWVMEELLMLSRLRYMYYSAGSTMYIVHVQQNV